MTTHQYDGVERAFWLSEDFERVRPALQGPNGQNYTHCFIEILIAKDFSRAIVWDGQSWHRTADLAEVEALAERFNLPALHRVAEKMRTATAP